MDSFVVNSVYLGVIAKCQNT